MNDPLPSSIGTAFKVLCPNKTVTTCHGFGIEWAQFAIPPHSGQHSQRQRKHFSLPSPAVVACFATTALAATLEKNATVGRPNSVVKKSFTTAAFNNRQELFGTSIQARNASQEIPAMRKS